MKLAAMLLLVSFGLAGADREFDRVVAEIESQYGVKRTHIPLMGVANLVAKVAKVAKPAGTSGLKIAIFENLDTGSRDAERGSFERFFDGIASGNLHPMIQVHSRNGESTYIATGEAGKSTRVLIVALGRNGATVIEAKVNLEALEKMLESPALAGKSFGTRKDWDRD